jgi:hypothetical protein
MTEPEQIELAQPSVEDPLHFLVPNEPNERYIQTVVKVMADSPIPVVKYSFANGFSPSHRKNLVW